MIFLTALPLFWIMISASRGGHWGAWMPSSISAFEGTCVSIPCRFDFPDELRPAVVHGVWYFNSPYPKNYPPVVFKSRTQVVHESFQGRSRLLGDLGLRNCTLLLSNVSPELGGKYYFRGDLGGYNQYTFSEHSVLDIVNTPNIVVPPEVVAGTEVEVSCMVPDNCPELRPELSWLGHEGLGEPAVLGRLREDEGTWVQVSLLHFVPTREANGHRLGCQASFPNTTLQFEGYASLDVKYPPVIVEMNSSVEAIEGSHVSLLCGADSNPPPLLTWMRDGTVLREAVAESLLLELEEVTPAEDGVYACLAENAYGQDNRTVGLSVMYAPWKPTVNGTMVAVEGETVSILCSTQSNPDPILTIFKEKQILSTVIYESELQLELPAVSPEDDGEYWCVAENQYGQRATAFNLSVEFAPVLLLESHCAAARDTVQCLCVVKSNPEPSVAFELPSRNVTVNESEREFVYSERSGLVLTSILTLRGQAQAPPRVICTARNLYGAKSLELPFQGAHRLMWAKIGPVGAVVTFAILIAIVCYITQTRRKKNVTESPSFSAGDNPPVLFSSDFRISGAPEKYEMLPGSLKREDTRKQGKGRSSVGEQEKPRGRSKRPDGSKTNSPLLRLAPRHDTMHLLGPWLLLLVLEYLAFSDSSKWAFEHPETLYAWEGACVWIPCTYRALDRDLESFILFHNPEYNKNTSKFDGTRLYESTKDGKVPSEQKRVQFLGDKNKNCTLSIHPVHVNDSGQLGLRMESKTAKWMERIHLNVSERPFPPHIQLPPEIQESQEVTLTCLLNFSCYGYPIQLQWLLEGVPMRQAAVTSTSLTIKSVFTRSELKFSPQWSHHGKIVTCQLQDADGKFLSNDTVQLNVKHTPKLEIKVTPSDAIVREGESVTMTCEVSSSNPEYTTISWLKDGTSLKKQNTLMLNLHEVTKDQSGKYCCQVSNDVGPGRSAEVFLQVQYAPEPSTVQILHSPAVEGSQVEFLCMSLANPLPTNYTWYHNGKEMQGRTEEKVHIPKILPWHAGTYSCVAENILGTGQRGPGAELDVQYPPKKVTTVIQNPTPIREGDTVTLSCNYNSSNPSVTRYEWKPHGAWEEPSLGVLKIQNVGWGNTTIACAACNSWCSWASPVALNVQYAPRDVRVRKIKPLSEIHSGNSVSLQCDFSSSHPKEVQFFWEKNGRLLGKESRLNFDSISPEDAGSYSCWVNNSIGQTASKAWTLEVLYAPRRLRVSMSPGDQVMEGKSATLTCESDANPPVSHYTWFDWNNQSLPYHSQKLRLEPVKVQHSGAYWCQGTNSVGKGHSPLSTLTVYYSPETIGRRVAVGFGSCLAILILAICGLKLQRRWKRTQSQQGLQENSSGQSFFVRNKKVRRAPLSEGPHSLGYYNPMMEDGISYTTLRFPETNIPRTGDAETSEMQSPPPDCDDTVTYSVLHKRQMILSTWKCTQYRASC
ncbi:B-cell receptor CD22 isoform X3 [Pan troglodytes]|uniref:B-cell receptor CD22 isoform X3 n=1 Tax=Pan troglodytes TaxID=9598 RepID=UPI003013C41C